MNYKEILENSVKVAQQAKNDIREIENVIESLNISIQDFTDGKMRFMVIDQFKNNAVFPTIAGSLAAGVIGAATAAFLSDKAKDSYKALCFYLVDNEKEFELAEFMTSENGYPCKISYANKDVYCSNKEEFELALADLMNTPNVGEILLDVMPK